MFSRTTMSAGRLLAAFLAISATALSQTTVSGKTVVSGRTVVDSQFSRFVSIYVVFPPTTGTDNTNFVANVMSQNSIDGVTLPLYWSNIETVAPDTTACVPSATCQPDPLVPTYFHHYNWMTYDSTTVPGIYPWFNAFNGTRKTVNLILIGEIAGSQNSATPHYVADSSWLNLFTPSRQDVINALKDCATGLPWVGTVPSGTVSVSGSTVTVNDIGCCSTTSTQSNLVQSGDTVWVNVTTPAACSTGAMGTTATTASAGQFTYPAPTGCSGAINRTNVTYISAIQSWPVPYELPYKSALKALWAATFLHYNSTYSISGSNVSGQLGYIRPGESVGGEVFPYCVSSLKALASPYTYVKSGSSGSQVGWLDYFDEMIDWGESQTPFMKFFAPIDTADSPPDIGYATHEASKAVVSSNGHGLVDGYGSQGLSLLDSLNTCPNATSNWCWLFGNTPTWYKNGSPLELQQISLSDPDDSQCDSTTSPPPLHACGIPPRDSGDMRTWLSFAVTNHMSVLELYYLDAALAFDPNYCASFNMFGECVGYSVGNSSNTFLTTALQATFMNEVGQGSKCSPPVSGAGGASTGNCAYATAINAAHGPQLP
jgi:hypothetical protein